MRYAGRVYDGPLEGERIESEYPWHPFNHCDPLSIADLRPTLAIPEMVEFQRFEYRWSAPLRAWVFVWPCAPTLPRKRPAPRRYGPDSKLSF